MIENYNKSKSPASGEIVDFRKYIGVASINVLAINPNNDKLRKFGWNIPEGADEPVYVSTKNDVNGNPVKSARVRFLVQICDLDEKPIVALDFWCRPSLNVNKTGDKCEIIDGFGRTAWATREEIKAKKIPVYSNGVEANISAPYKLCHVGEDLIVNFLLKYLNVTPLQIFDRAKQAWVQSKKPGKLTIDNWEAICDGDITELAEYCSYQPDNRVKVVLGLRSTEDNKTYQTFLNTGYIGNGALPDKNTGEYASARRLIDKFYESHADSVYSFTATPVKEWKETATEVKDNSLFDSSSTEDNPEGDLPF